MSYNPKVVSFERSSAYVHHRAMINRRENNPVDALELMRRAVESSPDNKEYQLDLAELYCEMGCHEQSTRLLLDMLAQKNAPAECFYGLALNQLSMNDLNGAKRSLWLYRQAEPDGLHADDVKRLASELDIADVMNRPTSRKLYRAMSIADSACTAMQEGRFEQAKRLFERSLSLSSEQYEMRAMYAMALLMNGEDEAAVKQAERAASGYPPSVKAMCVASQVYSAIDETETARNLLLKVMQDRPQGVELRLLIFSMGELEMHEEIAECARLALQETPYDRQLLHVRATALHHLGTPDKKVGHFWQRILRIDPEDSVAQFYQAACSRGELADNSPGYTYEVPEEECRRRAIWISGQFEGGLAGAQKRWAEESEFRSMILWATQAEDEKLRRAAVTVIAAMDDPAAQSSMRALMFGRAIQPELRKHAAMLLQLRGADMDAIFPAETKVDDAILPDVQELLDELLVGERQLIRYSAEILEDEYNISAMPELAMLWVIYRSRRGLKYDPLTNTEAASAALVYNYLMRHGKKPSIAELSKQFNCSQRRLIYYACRIADTHERTGGKT